MTRYVSAADANRQFSEILGQASKGERVVITRRGEPVAQLEPFTAERDSSARDGAWDRLLANLEIGMSLGGDRFDRESLYDR